MLNTIEQRLTAWSDLAVAGVPADAIFAQPEYDVYRRAFRLKRFQRCPSCDGKTMNRIEEVAHMGMYLWCSSCQWALFLWDYLARDPDEMILEIVRGVPVVE